MRIFKLTAVMFLAMTASPTIAQPEVVAEICSEAGVCAPVDPLTALAIIGVKVLVDELNSDKPFGPDGAVVSAVNTVLGDLERGGLGENNELVKAFRTVKNDLEQGLGQNNDIRRFFESLGVKL